MASSVVRGAPKVGPAMNDEVLLSRGESTPPQAGAPEGHQAGGNAPLPRDARIQLLSLALRAIRFGPGVILVGLFVAMTILSPYFLTETNIKNLGAQSSIVAALAIGQLLVITCRGVDISVGSTVAFAAVLPAVVLGTGASPLTFLLIALSSGVLVGTLNGALIVKGYIPQPLIVTLAVMGIVRGVAQIVSDGEPRVGLPQAVLTAGSGYVGPIPVPVLIVLAIAVVMHLALRNTQWGRWVYAVGGNPEGASRLGVPVGRIVFSTYLLCGMTAAVAGVLVAGRTATASPLAGQLLELDSIIAVIIGGSSLFGGRGTVPGALTGALILGTIRNGLDLLGVEPFWQTVAIGTIVLVALELDVLRGRLEDRMRTMQARYVEVQAR